MKQATIFANDKARIEGKNKCFGVRFDTQALPAGSVVYGFITRRRELILEARTMTDEQYATWKECIQYARDVLNGEWTSDDNYPLVSL